MIKCTKVTKDILPPVTKDWKQSTAVERDDMLCQKREKPLFHKEKRAVKITHIVKDSRDITQSGEALRDVFTEPSEYTFRGYYWWFDQGENDVNLMLRTS